MGRTLILVSLAVALAFGMLSAGKGQRLLRTSGQAAHRFAAIQAENTAWSGVQLGLQQLYLDPGWRSGFLPQILRDDTLTVVVDEPAHDPGLAHHALRVRATARNAWQAVEASALIFNASVSDFAVWSADSVEGIQSYGWSGVADSLLIVENAPFMPEFDFPDLHHAALAQGNVRESPVYFAANNFPADSFYTTYGVPFVSHIIGDLVVQDQITIYGIFLVEGSITVHTGGRIEGVCIVKPPGEILLPGFSSLADTAVSGGLISWGPVTASTMTLVQHQPEFLRACLESYAEPLPPVHVTGWHRNILQAAAAGQQP